MKTITTNTGSVKIYSNDILLRTVPKGSFFLSLDWQKEQVVMSLNGTATFFVFPADTTIDGQGYDDAEGLADALSAFSRGGGTGEGVQWDDVQNKPLKELTTPIADAEGLVPVYTQGGQLPVGIPEFPENAVPLALLDIELAGKLSTPTGTPSATVFARGDGTWATPTNTTYGAMNEAEFNSGTGTTPRSVTAVGLNRDIQAKVISYLTSLDGYAEGAVLTATATGFEWVLPSP